MKKHVLLAISLLLPTWVHAHGDLTPIHGGLITEGKAITIELVAQSDVTMVYLSEHGTPIDASAASGELILLSGGKKSQFPLAPAGDNALAGPGITPEPNAKAVIRVNVPDVGKEQIRFALK
ncbi:hypothetical protein [Oceanisphaera arctica]|uniref:Uncharacterized protein n=1 Tax=Oceanisphaera arctica TaxID=641510 RepID=A0A2P5TQZ5_9GAMM|nr:hypothetical protein [Oceanisphaera arctica]PPL18218.1 hypothetical protein UN63_01515 [Oceanisphaera arctica]GHA12698.1 hypothetical protein GCM10007082_12140 [Oceanisphaera arctica]